MSTLDVLTKHGLIGIVKQGRLQQTNGSVEIKNDNFSTAFQNYHKQMLENAKTVLNKQNVCQGDFNSETLAIKEADIPRAKEIIRKFKSEFTRLFETEEGDQVYQLQLQFFSLTQDLY